ncbi:hypothetical protein J2X16_001185 [Pelomonas aquatica]|uniref:CARDB domain-containing protein n=1 Tax=Pelomonas aquatica TaxID=431058 RepID=A0ABU1Z742_9BURK|nr:hypothetical protein [Pelomonas aquatica]MDR7295846.1 hypothetical protein [Pelomonas aquatica]
MQFNPLAIVGTLLGGLLLAGLLGWIRKPRLIVLVPRSFLYSGLTDRGQLVEISIFNRGFKTEDSVEIALDHKLKYELLGTNYQDAALVGNKIKIPRIGPSDEVTVLLLIENGTFSQADIIQCLSKENKGEVVKKLEEIPPTGQQRIGIVGMIIAVPCALYGLTYGMDFLYKEFGGNNLNAHSDQIKDDSLNIRGWNFAKYSKSSKIFADFENGAITVVYGDISKKQDLVTVPIIITNNTDQLLRARFNMMTANSPKRFKSYELMSDEIVVAPKRSERISIRVVVPVNPKDESDRMLFVDGHITNTAGQDLIFKGTRDLL